MILYEYKDKFRYVNWNKKHGQFVLSNSQGPFFTSILYNLNGERVEVEGTDVSWNFRRVENSSVKIGKLTLQPGMKTVFYIWKDGNVKVFDLPFYLASGAWDFCLDPDGLTCFCLSACGKKGALFDID